MGINTLNTYGIRTVPNNLDTYICKHKYIHTHVYIYTYSFKYMHPLHFHMHAPRTITYT